MNKRFEETTDLRMTDVTLTKRCQNDNYKSTPEETWKKNEDYINTLAEDYTTYINI